MMYGLCVFKGDVTVMCSLCVSRRDVTVMCGVCVFRGNVTKSTGDVRPSRSAVQQTSGVEASPLGLCQP